MKRFAAFFFAALCAVSSSLTAHAAEPTAPPAAVSDAYVVMDAVSGQVLVEKNMHKKEFPASITKILTVALGMEQNKNDVMVTVNDSATRVIGSHIALLPGEQVSFGDLAYATMLPSANDAANAIAEQTAGSIDAFARKMNEKAKALGCADTNFTNANGLPDDNHYTSAYDMALITRYAINVPGFMEVFGAADHTIAPTNKQPVQRLLGTEHMMLVTSAYYYEGTLGGKLGWTEDAQHTAVTLVERGGMKLICVVMKSTRYDKFKDSIALFDYCFNNFKPLAIDGAQWDSHYIPRTLASGAKEMLGIYSDETYRFLVPKTVAAGDVQMKFHIPDTVTEGDDFAPTVEFSLKSRTDGAYTSIGTFPLKFKTVPNSVAMADASAFSGLLEPVTLGAEFWSGVQNFFQLVGRVLLWVCVAAGVIFLALLIIRIINKIRVQQRRRRRMARMRQMEYRPPVSSGQRRAVERRP